MDTSTEVTAVGQYARLYDRSGAGTVIFSGVPNYNDANQGDLGVGSFKLIDNRDQKPYLIRRLADGNCWMVQNLDLNLADFAGTTNLTSQNTDLNSKTVWNPSASYAGRNVQYQSGNMVGLSYNWQDDYPRSFSSTDYGYETTDQSTGAPTWIANYGDPALTDPLNNSKDSVWTASHAMQYVNDYYNWYAATAESVSSAIDVDGAEAPDSICAYGWQLPTSGSDNTANKSFYRLYSKTYLLPNDSATSVSYAKKTPMSLALSGNHSTLSTFSAKKQG